MNSMNHLETTINDQRSTIRKTISLQLPLVYQMWPKDLNQNDQEKSSVCQLTVL